LMGLSLVVTWWWLSRHSQVPLAPRHSWRQRWVSIRSAFWALLLPLVIILGMKFGVFTPTEAAVVAAVYSGLIGAFVYGELRPAALYRALVRSAKTSAVVMFLVAASLVSAWLITVANIPEQLIALLKPFSASPVTLMFLMMLIVLIVGTALDFTPTILILTPVLVPIVKDAGIDPVYFGVLFIINNAIGLITPPVGNVLNVVCSVSRVAMDDVIRGVMPFLFAETLVLLLLVMFPSLVLGPLHWLMR
jgi:TRAP-type transport system large permease protein